MIDIISLGKITKILDIIIRQASKNTTRHASSLEKNDINVIFLPP